MKDVRATPALDALFKDIERLREAEEILHEIYMQRYVDPNSAAYRVAEMRMNDYFGYDDSE